MKSAFDLGVQLGLEKRAFLKKPLARFGQASMDFALRPAKNYLAHRLEPEYRQESLARLKPSPGIKGWARAARDAFTTPTPETLRRSFSEKGVTQPVANAIVDGHMLAAQELLARGLGVFKDPRGTAMYKPAPPDLAKQVAPLFPGRKGDILVETNRVPTKEQVEPGYPEFFSGQTLSDMDRDWKAQAGVQGQRYSIPNRTTPSIQKSDDVVSRNGSDWYRGPTSWLYGNTRLGNVPEAVRAGNPQLGQYVVADKWDVSPHPDQLNPRALATATRGNRHLLGYRQFADKYLINKPAVIAQSVGGYLPGRTVNPLQHREVKQ
jgi:hypothetical protein